jgi:tetratricopeptide (TPR) repeat protein
MALLLAGCSSAGEMDALWEKGNEAYLAGDYSGAIGAYEGIVGKGLESHKLYYNLANAYFKDGQLGRAILFYNRALQLRPGDGDTRFNLQIAESRVKVRIEPVPQFFLARWVVSLRQTLGSNGWAVVSLVALAAGLGAALLYLLSEKRMLRKAGFYTALVCIGLLIVSVWFSLAERRAMLHSGDAIVMRATATVKSSPDDAGKDAFILYEGTKVRIVSTLGDWREVELVDGNRGWIASGAIETVR